MSHLEPAPWEDLGPPGSDEPTVGVPRQRSQFVVRPRRDGFWQTVGLDPMGPLLIGLVLALVAGVMGAVLALRGPTTYTSKTVMLIDDPYQLATSGAAGEYFNLDALRYKYAGLANTQLIAGPVATTLNLPLDSVIGSVSTIVPSSSLLMDINATWSSPHEAQVLSQGIADQVSSYVRAEDARDHIPANQQFTFTTVDPASVPLAKGPSRTKALTLAIGLAVLFFILGLLGTQLARYLRAP